jgi:hypothetical protein
MLTAQNNDCLMWPVVAHSKVPDDIEDIEKSAYNYASRNFLELQARYAAGKYSLAVIQHRLIVSRTDFFVRRFMAQSSTSFTTSRLGDVEDGSNRSTTV